jgi:hypothetical protein
MLGRLLLLIPIVIIPSGNSMRPWAKHDKGAENVIFTPFLAEGKNQKLPQHSSKTPFT